MNRIALAMPYAIAFSLLLVLLAWIFDSIWDPQVKLVPLAAFTMFAGGLPAGFLLRNLLEPVILRRMLRQSLRRSGARGAVVLAANVPSLAAVVNTFRPVKGSVVERFYGSNTVVRAAERLIAVRVSDGLELRTGFGGEHVLAQIAAAQFAIKQRGQVAILELVQTDGSTLATFEVLDARGRRFKPASFESTNEELG